jgi:hypothetical protein
VECAVDAGGATSAGNRCPASRKRKKTNVSEDSVRLPASGRISERRFPESKPYSAKLEFRWFRLLTQFKILCGESAAKGKFSLCCSPATEQIVGVIRSHRVPAGTRRQ